MPLGFSLGLLHEPSSYVKSDGPWPDPAPCRRGLAPYTRLLHVFADRPRIRIAYDRGELEIMSPSLEHDDASRILAILVFVLTEELGLPLKSGGSTTLKRRLKRRGIEADECFWIANAGRMTGRRKLELRIDPPPI